jgi:hypothetical protein
MQKINRLICLSSIFFTIGLFSYANITSADVEGIPYNSEFPNAQYPYAQAPDGCSGWQSTRQIRDTWGPVNFTEACNQHDRCYYTFGSNWNTCNERFYSDLRAACERDLRIPIRVPDPTLRDPLRTRVVGYGPPEPASLTTCYGIASKYYAGVQVGVLLDVFRKAQDKQKQYEKWVISVINNTEEERIKQLYRQVLGREADPDGLQHHLNILRSGQQTFEQIRAGMASGQESRNNINNLYRQYLNRDADPGGMEHHVNLLASGQMTLDQIREGIRNGQEAQQLRSR